MTDVLQVLKSRLEPNGFHGFSYEVKTGVVHFFSPNGMATDYQVARVGAAIELRLNFEAVGYFEDGDDLADFILI